MNVLLTLIGNRDPYTTNEGEELGPVLSLLQARTFDRVYLFYTGSRYLERARTVEELGRTMNNGTLFHLVEIDLESPVDYEEVFSRLAGGTDQLVQSIGHLRPTFFVLLDPGTPQMQTAWFLIVRSGMLQATLLQGVPPRFAAGSYRVKEVRLEGGVLPEVRIAPATKSAVDATGRSARWHSQPTATTIIGENATFISVLEHATRVADYDISVLILGETGTGKGLIARRIHESSRRRGQPFVSVNCAAITASLVESELFGHTKGAFTGAATDRMGLFRSAEGGTIFLDEIGDLPPEMQPKLLRVLEDKSIVPVGEDREVAVNVRVIAATNRNLEELIQTPQPNRFEALPAFRRDLFERLNQISIRLPPLRERPEDIPLLIRHYIDEWNRRYHEQKTIDETAMSYLIRYPWPGNVRELANSVSSMCATSRADTIGETLLPRAVRTHFDHASDRRPGDAEDIPFPDEGINLPAYLHSLEAQYYREALERSGGNREAAARLLGINGPAFRKAWRERFGPE